jgi:hypothetical protein
MEGTEKVQMEKGEEDECFLLLFLYLIVSKESHHYACPTTTDTD